MKSGPLLPLLLAASAAFAPRAPPRARPLTVRPSTTEEAETVVHVDLDGGTRSLNAALLSARLV